MDILYFIFYIFISFLFLFLFHIIITRFLLKFKKENFSSQKLLFFLIIFFNIPALVFFCYIFKNKFNLYSFIYYFIVFNSFAYMYFHFFNMSETARRIKILIQIKMDKIKTVKDIESFYDYNETLDIRLKRLVELSQIKILPGNMYILKNRLLFLVANLIVFFRSLLNF